MKTKELRAAVDSTVLIKFFEDQEHESKERLLLLCGEAGEISLCTSPFELEEVENYLVNNRGVSRSLAREKVARLEEIVSSKFCGGFRARLGSPEEVSLSQAFLVDVACSNRAQVLLTETKEPYDSLGRLAMTPDEYFEMLTERYDLDYQEISM